MGAWMAVCLANIEVCCVIVARKDHGASSEGDAVVCIGCHIFQKLVDGVVGCFGGSRLLLDEFDESNYDLVVDCLFLLKKIYNNGLDAEDSCGVQVGAVVRACGVLDFGAARYGSVLV